MSYFVIEVGSTDDIARFDLHGYDRDFELKRIAPLGRLPPTAVMKASRGKRVTPVLCASFAFVVSASIRTLLESLGPKDLEFLPLPVQDAAGQPVKEPYFAVHPLVMIDCVDRDKSRIEWNRTNPEQADAIESLVLKPGSLPDRALFARVKYLGWRLIVHRDVLDALAGLRSQPFLYQPLDSYRERSGAVHEVTPYDPPAKRRPAPTAKRNAHPLPPALDAWVGKRARLDHKALPNVPDRAPCFVFRWAKVSAETKELLLEQLGSDAQEAVISGALKPFAILGDCKESGEKLTLANVLDTQTDGILFYDGDLAVHCDTGGRLCALKLKAGALKLKAATVPGTTTRTSRSSRTTRPGGKG